MTATSITLLPTFSRRYWLFAPLATAVPFTVIVAPGSAAVGVSRKLEIEFGILKDGRLQFIEVVRRSEYDVYDESAKIAIQLASPFPPLPPVMLSAAKPGSTGVPIRARFVYLIVKSSLTSMYRPSRSDHATTPPSASANRRIGSNPLSGARLA